MPPKILNNSIAVTVESENGHLVKVELNSRMRKRCPAISAMPPGTTLPGVKFKPFEAVTSYLGGDDSLSVFASHVNSNAFLHLFAQTWTLAAQLGLPTLQNELMLFMTKFHTRIVDGRDTGLRLQHAADGFLNKAFQHLRDQVDPYSHAERFLICFASRTAPLICELERNLNRHNVDGTIRNNILMEARSFGPDPIKHQPHLFLIDPHKPPNYRPLELRLDETGPAEASSSSCESPSLIRGDDACTRKQPQTCGVVSNATGNQPQRCPRALYPPLRSPHSDGIDRGSTISVRIQPGDHCDSAPWYPPQATDFDASIPPIDDTAGIICMTGRGENRPPTPPSAQATYSPSSAPSPPPSPPPLGRCKHHDNKQPFIIKITQNSNNNSHNKGSRIQHGDSNSAVAKVQGSGGRGNRSVRAVADSGELGYRLITEKKGKRFKWFSFLTCGSKYY